MPGTADQSVFSTDSSPTQAETAKVRKTFWEPPPPPIPAPEPAAETSVPGGRGINPEVSSRPGDAGARTPGCPRRSGRSALGNRRKPPITGSGGRRIPARVPRRACPTRPRQARGLPWVVAVECKPSSVGRGRPGDHFSGAAVADDLRAGSRTNRLEHATRPARGPRARRTRRRRSCLRLHAVGFAVPRSSPIGRCALTAPFHPCRPSRRGWRSVLCGTFPDPQPRVGGRYPPPCPVVLGLSSPTGVGAITLPR